MQTRTYHYKVTDAATGKVLTDEDRPVTVRFEPGRGEPVRIRFAVEAGGAKDREALAVLARKYKLTWLPGPEAWETGGLWSDPETHRKLRAVIEADGFTVLDDFDTYKAAE